ncbi:MAG: TIGR01244 family sulfur transferase [Sphingomicrobium sp.]
MTVEQLTPDYAVRPQIALDEIAGLAAAGYKGIVNARPDGEEPGQPTSSEIEAEARRHGLAYWHIPVVAGAPTEEQARALDQALAEAGGPLVGYCKSGNRAGNLWKLARTLDGSSC